MLPESVNPSVNPEVKPKRGSVMGRASVMGAQVMTKPPRRASTMFQAADAGASLQTTGCGSGDVAWLALYSTATTLSWYGNNCPPGLTGAVSSLASFEFDKWPTVPEQQEAAAIGIAKELMKRKTSAAVRILAPVVV
jgi:hypothetical protein